MPLLRLSGFAGEIPKLQPRMLQDAYAQVAQNTRLDDGGLTPIRKRQPVYNFTGVPPAGYDTIYKHAGVWYGWQGDVSALPGPVAADRIYVFNDGAPKMISGGITYPLAVPFPSAALTAAIGGTATSTIGSTRVYVYTFVTSFGEESEPCAAANEVYWKPGQNVTLSGFQAAPAGRAITLQRIYRSQTGLTGTKLFLIAERAASAANYVDTVATNAFKEELPSVNWNAPPADLKRVISLPNGMMAGISGKILCFCEPYRPHAWPVKYQMVMDYSGVGLGAYGNTLVALTDGPPNIVTGTAPENMVMEKTELNLPCIDARSIVDLGYGIAYASNDGLVMAEQGAIKLATGSLFSRDDWMKMGLGVGTAGQYNGRYYTVFSYLDGLISRQGMLIFDFKGEQPFVIRTDAHPRAMFHEPGTGYLYVLEGAVVSLWDSISMPNEIQSWRSKIFVVPRPTNFGVILVESDSAMTADEQLILEAEIAAAIAANSVLFAQMWIGGSLNETSINTLGVNDDYLIEIPSAAQSCSVLVYADDLLVASVGKLNSMERLPSGFRAAKWEIEVTGDAPVTQVLLVGTGAELMGA
jgi:hypothetical protein